jgi:hypothetical protein
VVGLETDPAGRVITVSQQKQTLIRKAWEYPLASRHRMIRPTGDQAELVSSLGDR